MDLSKNIPSVDKFELNEFVETYIKILHSEFYKTLFETAREDFKIIYKSYQENLIGVSLPKMSRQDIGYFWTDISREEEKLHNEYIREIELAEEDLACEISDFVDKNLTYLSADFRQMVNTLSIAQGIMDRVINPQHYQGKVRKLGEVA